MKSLVLKDLFNIGHNAKSMLFILVVFAVALIPFSGVEGYIFVCAILCSMMIVTTFSFDDSSKWTRYAMIMPVSKKELVAGKFMVLAIFCAIGSLFGGRRVYPISARDVIVGGGNIHCSTHQSPQ